MTNDREVKQRKLNEERVNFWKESSETGKVKQRRKAKKLILLLIMISDTRVGKFFRLIPKPPLL